MESFDVNSILVNGKMTYGTWRRLSVEQRSQVTDGVLDGIFELYIFDDIAPALRVDTLPEDHKIIQMAYISEKGKHPRSQPSIDILRETLSREKDALAKILENQQKLMEEYMKKQDQLAKEYANKQEQFEMKQEELVKAVIESNERAMHVSNINAGEGTSGYFGWDLEPGFRFKLFDENDDYTVLEDYNYRNNVIRYTIEPIESLQNPRGYFHSLKHLITENQAFQEMVKRMRPTINLETLDEKGESRFYSFNLSMGVDQLMYELWRIFEESEEEYGSDTYKFIRRHLTRMSITVSKTPSGGCPTPSWKNSIKPYFTLRDQPPQVKKNKTCFYHCIRAIRKDHDGKDYTLKAKTMCKLYKGSILQNETFDMSLDRMKDTEDIFGIKLIVLANEEPQIVFDDESIKYTSYESIKRKYHFLWKCYYFDSPLGQKDVLDVSLAESCGSDVGWVVINGVKYYLMLYHDDHYSIIFSLAGPDICGKCGSQDHTIVDLTNPYIKLKCLENLQGFLSKEAIKLALPEYELIFFDYETFMRNYRQCPYMVSYIVCDPIFNIISKETISGYDCSKKFVKRIANDINKLKFLIGFNSASFDNYFIMTDMIGVNHSSFSSDNSIIYKNKMLRLRDERVNIITWDLFQFVKSSLADACKAYKIDGAKGEVDHKKVWKLFKQHDYEESVFDNEEYKAMNIEEYCEKDVVLTMELFKCIYKELFDFTGIEPLTKPTLSSLVYAYFKPKFKKISIRYDYIFSSVPGGRTQVFQRGHHVGKFALIDINSSYPHISIENKFGTGNVFEISDASNDERVKELLTDPKTGEERLYICLCDVDQSSLPIKLIGFRPDKNSTLNWTSDIVENQWLQPEVIKTLELYGCPVVKKKYLVWEKSDYALKEKMEFLRDERMKAKENGNKVKELIVKILGNGMTGKCGEKNHNETWCIATNVQEVEQFKRKYPNTYTIDILKHKMFLLRGENPPKGYINKPRHWNVRILDLARLALWEYAMLFQPHELYYCDTDSLIVDDVALRRLIQSGKITLDKKKYGAMDLEATSDDIFIVSPKNYYMNEKKMSLKSYRDGDVWTAYYKDEKGEADKQRVYKTDTKRCKDIYECLLRDDLVVTTTFTKITKKIGRKDENGEIELNLLHTVDTEKILE